jgi:hypothetical protein
MTIQVLVERIADNGFRATSGEPIPLSVEAATRDEALSELKERLEARLQEGAEIVPLELPPPAHPLAEFIGMYSADDPVVVEWKKSMAEYRRKIDDHPELP